jgi:hypothetical protein
MLISPAQSHIQFTPLDRVGFDLRSLFRQPIPEMIRRHPLIRRQRK